MPPRFHSERKSVNTQSSTSRDQAYTGFAPILLTRYKKVLMPTYFLKMHLESLAHFDLHSYRFLSIPYLNGCPNQTTLAQSSTASVSLRHKSIRYTKFNPKYYRSTHRCSTRRYRLVPSLNLSPVLNLCIMHLSPSHPSTHYIHIMTPLWFSIIFCYQFALINTTFLLPAIIIISTHHASSYGQRR